MKKLHIFMLKSFVGPFVATFFISMFVLIMQFLWRMIDEIVGKGLDMSIIAELLMTLSVTQVPTALPLAILLSSIMTFGSLGENYELIALKAAGVSLYRIMYPLIVLVAVLTIGAFFFSNNVLPIASLKFNSLLYDVKKQKPELSFKEGIFTNDLEGYSIKIDRINKESGMMHGVLIYNHKETSGNYEVTKADSGRMVTDPRNNVLELTLHNGYTYTDEGMKSAGSHRTFPFRRLGFDKEVVQIVLPGTDFKRTDEERFRSHAMMLSLRQLDYSIDSVQNYLSARKTADASRLLSSNYIKNKSPNILRDSVIQEQTRGTVRNVDSLFLSYDPDEQQRSISNALQFARDVKQRNQDDLDYYVSQQENVIKYKIEWQRKFTLSFACLIFFFIGAPLGGIIRKGGLGMPVVVSIFLFIIYYVISMMGERSAKETVIEPWVGMWISSLVFLPLGILLTYKSMTDSEVMNVEAYTKFFKKIFGFLKKAGKHAKS